MSDTSPLESTLLKHFAAAREHKLSATALRKKLEAADADEADQAINALIDGGKLGVTGAKAGPHPRPKGSYRLTGAGKDHVKPQRPDVSDELVENQEAYLLFQFLRIKDGESSMSRSDLNGKLKTKAAKEQFELDPKVNKSTIDYHLDQLVHHGSLDEKRQGVSMIYTLTDSGLRTLGAGKQYDHPSINFTLNGPALNRLLTAARSTSAPRSHAHELAHTAPELESTPPVPSHSAEVTPEAIHAFIAQLQADQYAGRDQIPIHEVRALVARNHGEHAASHPVFDKLLKRMRSEGDLIITAIADSRHTSPEHLNDSIPGMNETLFFIDTQ